MIPITILTGFLGSGKTTLLSRLLHQPDFSKTAVIINEFGDIGLDHDLVETGDESLVELTNGCLCCRVHSDLSQTLMMLNARLAAGDVSFDRVVIETSGLANPIPIIQTFMTDTNINTQFVFDRLITTIDLLSGASIADRYDEARKQVMMADLVLLTKSDLADRSDNTATHEMLDRLNPTAPRVSAHDWSDVLTLLDGAPGDAAGINSHAALRMPVGHGHDHHHASAYSTVCIVRDKPIPASVLPLFLEGLAMYEGERLLRLKGIIQVAEVPDRPVVIHGVLHVFHQGVWLDHWPSDDHNTRIVMIGHGLSAQWAHLLLEALEAEVEAVAKELSPT